MKRNLSAFAAIAALCWWSGALVSGDEKAKTAQTGKESPKEGKGPADMMEAWMKYAAPGEHHDQLKVFAGNWKTTTKFWMMPGSEPQVSQGTCKNEWILGGRFLQSSFKSTSAEHPFEGFGLLGYDTLRKQHVSVWCDTDSTMAGVSYGDCDATGKVFTYTASYENPMSGPQKMKMVSKVIDDKKHVFTLHNVAPDGKEQLALEVTYERAQ